MAVRRMMLFVALVACLALANPAWAGSLQFHGNDFAGQGTLSFTPGVGNALTIGPPPPGSGALITDFFNSYGICGGDCSVIGGFMTLTSGGETSGFAGGGLFSYTFGAGGNITIKGEIPILGINTPTILFTASFLNGSSFTGAGTVGSFVGALNLASISLAPQLGLYKYSGASTDALSFNLDPACATGGVCNGTIVQSDTSFQTIPEPATLSVLGVGLFTFGTGLRRRMATPKVA